MVSIVVPGIPPSVNHYVKHTRAGRHYKTDETNRFLWTLKSVVNDSHRIRGKAYQIAIIVYLGKGDQRDWDNVPKSLQDGLVKLGVIDSDSKVKRGSVEVRRDWANPRTEVTVDLFVEV